MHDLALAAAVILAIFAVALFAVAYLEDSVKLALMGLALTGLAVGAFGIYRWSDDAPKDTEHIGSVAERNYDKARLYFVTHYPDLKVLEFDTDQGLVRYERQEPRRVCKASLIQDGKIFLLGDDETCPVLPQGG